MEDSVTRIKLIMEKESLSSTQFADRLGIGRAVVSHLLNGRNRLTLETVSKILDEMDYINPEWLLNGKGEMYKDGARRGISPKNVDLFTQSAVNAYNPTPPPIKAQEIVVKTPEIDEKIVENKVIEVVKMVPRKTTQIIIYYDDNTFEVLRPNS